MLMDALPSGELARHHRNSAWRTDRAVDGEVGEVDSLFGHTVNVGRLAESTAVATQVSVAPIIGEDENDIWLVRSVCADLRERDQ